MHVIIVNRKLASHETFGPYDNSYTAGIVAAQLAHAPWVKTAEIVPVKELRTDDDGHLVATAYL